MLHSLRCSSAALCRYVLTGEDLYLNAVLSAWRMFRDNWIHVGGSLAINEAQYYAPGSYHLDADTPDLPHRDTFRLLGRKDLQGATPHGDFSSHSLQHRNAGDEDGEGGTDAHTHRRLPNEAEDPESNEGEHAHSGGPMHQSKKADTGHKHHGHTQNGHNSDHHGDGNVGEGGDWGNYPTGEMCGAVFWTKLNQRFHRLFPDNETFVGEIERELYNEALGHQGANGDGIRYFSNLNGVKENPAAIGTCCEGQGTRIYGSLNEHLYSLSPAGVYVDVYAPSTITLPFGGALLNVTTVTEFPYGNGDVQVLVSASAAVTMDVALRMPTWVSSASIDIEVSTGGSVSGVPGTYTHISQKWNAGITTLSFNLPRVLTPHLYTGVTQIANHTRYAFTYGPILLAATGAWDSDLNVLPLSGVNPSQPDTWLIPAGGNNTLHFNVSIGSGSGVVTFLPHFEIQYEQFSAYPAFA